MAFCDLESKHKGVLKTLFGPIKVLEYMKKHKIFEIISELMIGIGIERPSNGEEIIDFMIMKLIEIAKKFDDDDDERNVMKIEFHNCCNVGMLRELSMKLRIPLVECYSNEEVEKEREKLCKRHLIICEFSDKSPQDDRKDHKCLKAVRDLKYLIPNIRIMRNPLRSSIEWNKRVLFTGRFGSGRKTQASLLARELGLIFIDLNQMLKEYNRTCDMGFWGFLQETLLKPDCLCNGYVIVSNVISSRETARILMEKFIHAPNQIVFIHTSESKCRQRILRQHEGILSSYRGITSSPPSSSSSATAAATVDVNALLNYHMDQYNLHKHQFISALRGRIYHINGNGSVNDTKTSIWAYLAHNNRNDLNPKDKILPYKCN